MILITADLHWNDKARDSYRHDYVDTIAEEIEKNEVECLVILGDLTDEWDNHGAWLVDMIFNHIYCIAKLCRVIILKGNHDYRTPDFPFFRCLGKLENVTWINDPSRGGPDELWLPHTNNYQKDWEDWRLDGYETVFAHNTFKGAKSESGQELDGIHPSVFSKNQTVISGDVHVPQKVGPVEYVGSPYPVDFGDDLDKHMILLNDEGKISYIPYEGPRKILLDLDLDESFEADDILEGDILKVRVNLGPAEFSKFQDYKAALTKHFEGMGCIVHMVQPVFDRGGAVQTRRRLRKRTDLQVLKDYASATKVKEPVVRTGVRIMGKT